MKLILVYALLALSPHSSLAQDHSSKSIGVITLNRFEETDSLKFYNDDGSIWLSFSPFFREDESVFIMPEKFNPLSFHPDYFLFSVKTIAVQDGLAEVIVNEENRTAKFVNLSDSTLVHRTWIEYFNNAVCIGVNPSSNTIYEQPSVDASQVFVQTQDELCAIPIIVEEDWLRVKWPADGRRLFGEGNEIKDWKTGWLKWRDENDNLQVYVYQIP